MFSGCTGFNWNLSFPTQTTRISQSIRVSQITEIGNRAFYNCHGLRGTLTIPDTVINIGYDSFFNCTSFTGSLKLPNSLTTINNRAFANCSGFNEILTIGSNVNSISDDAFVGTKFTSVEFLGNANIENCESLGGIDISKVKVPDNYNGNQFCNIDIEKGSAHKKSGLSVGVIVAIVVSICVVVVIAVVVAFVIISRKKGAKYVEDLNSDDLADATET